MVKLPTLKDATNHLEDSIITLSGPALVTIKHVTHDCQCEGKQCRRCETVKCVGEFHKEKRNISGITSFCEVCHKATGKEYYQQNAGRIKSRMNVYRETYPDRIQEQTIVYRTTHSNQIVERKKTYHRRNAERINAEHRAYYQQNAERMSAYYRTYYQENSDQVKERARANYWQDPARCQERMKAYYHAYPERFYVYSARRRAQKVKSGGTFTSRQWENLKIQYRSTCLCCGKIEPEIKLHADHVIPLSKGGHNGISNIQPLCRSCNSRKGTKIVDYRPVIEVEA